MPKLSEEERALECPIPEGMKRCSRCRDDKTPEMFDRSAKQPDGRGLQCKDCRKRVKAESLAANPIPPAKRREYTARWKARHPQRAKASERRHGLRRYGLTPERYAQMVTDQRGVCAICHKPESVVDPQSGETSRSQSTTATAATSPALSSASDATSRSGCSRTTQRSCGAQPTTSRSGHGRSSL